MQRTCLLLFLLLGYLPVKAQRTYIDRAPSSGRNLRAVEGGSLPVRIDTETPLPKLIDRLNGNWELVETGKGYWIGYTDDMYSIAEHQEAAIEPLLDFINGPSTEYGKIGAAYCLHLIGIQSSIAGRTYEKFRSVKAREALLKLVEQPALQTAVMRLLIRDPWQSDVPVLFDALGKTNGNCWAVVNGLMRYKIINLPIHQPIPEQLDEIRLKVSKIRSWNSVPFDKPFEAQFVSVLEKVKALHNEAVFIEDTLFHSKLWGEWMTDLGDGTREGTNQLTLGIFLRQVTEVSYSVLGGRIQYFTEDGQRLFICSPLTAKQKLISWWNDQSPEVKNHFQEHAAKR